MSQTSQTTREIATGDVGCDRMLRLMPAPTGMAVSRADRIVWMYRKKSSKHVDVRLVPEGADELDDWLEYTIGEILFDSAERMTQLTEDEHSAIILLEQLGLAGSIYQFACDILNEGKTDE